MDDNSVLTFGEHKGKKLANVPADYLIFLYIKKKCSPELRAYIKDNEEVLIKESYKYKSLNDGID